MVFCVDCDYPNDSRVRDPLTLAAELPLRSEPPKAASFDGCHVKRIDYSRFLGKRHCHLMFKPTRKHNKSAFRWLDLDVVMPQVHSLFKEFIMFVIQ